MPSHSDDRNESSLPAAHTPGPWIAGTFSSVVGIPVVATPIGRAIAAVHCFPGNAPHAREFNAVAAANARLIAAAPDLLAALRRLASPANFSEESLSSHSDDCRCCICEARAAIMKAMGSGTNG
jgi:hypothetical protein